MLIYIGLVHHPVLNKNGDEIASAVTIFDIHDIARTAKTYGVKNYFIITPLEEQKDLTRRVIHHWTKGFGSSYNPNRKEAVELIKIVDSIDEACRSIELTEGIFPYTIATGAKKTKRDISFKTGRSLFKNGNPILLLFGTAWGLADRVINGSDYSLASISGPADYNHLSVRSAAAIILDRLFGGECAEDINNEYYRHA